jgi:hypothetical protein
MPPVPKIAADLPGPAVPGRRTEEIQRRDPDPCLPRARSARGRFAAGSSGNPRGRPRGIPNPKRRVPDLVVRPLSPQALAAFLDRKPHLLRPLAGQLLPPPLAAADPTERLGIDLSSLRAAEDARRVLSVVWAALSRGDIAPAAAARVARRVRTRLRALRRLARLVDLPAPLRAVQGAEGAPRLVLVDGRGRVSLDPAPSSEDG